MPAQDQLEASNEERLGLYQALGWALSQQESYDYGELPMSGRRLQLLQGVLPQLASLGFQGVVRLEGHVGAFCLSDIVLEDGSQLAIPAASESPVSSCASIGSSARQAVQLSVQQSDEFAGYINVASDQYPQISIDIVARGESAPIVAYPASLDQITAGDWNSVALVNNRVTLELIPSRP